MFQDGIFTEDGHCIMWGLPAEVIYWLLTNRQTNVRVHLGEYPHRSVSPAEYIYEMH